MAKAKYRALLDQLQDVITKANDLLKGAYDPLDTEEPDLVEDTETIRDSATQLHQAITRLQKEGTHAEISDLAHDLRGMINGILGWADIICQGLDGDLTEKQEPVYADLFKAGGDILVKVDTLIDYARLDINVLKYVDDEEVEWHEVFAEPFQLQANTPALTINLPKTFDVTPIKGDIQRTRQALYYILAALDADRSVQITQPNGRVAITASGKPLFQADAGTAFDPYVATSADEMGLGLPLAKGLIEQMGGSVALNLDGDAAAFTVHLPADQDGKRQSST